MMSRIHYKGILYHPTQLYKLMNVLYDEGCKILLEQIDNRVVCNLTFPYHGHESQVGASEFSIWESLKSCIQEKIEIHERFYKI